MAMRNEERRFFMKTTLYIVRHGEAEGNINRTFHGWTDSSLTPKGHRQCEQLAKRLESIDFDEILSSPLKRTKQTVEYILRGRKNKISLNENLKEINGGEWEGVSWEDLSINWPKEYEIWDVEPHLHQMPNGESVAGFQKRLIQTFDDIIKTHQGKRICIVTHGTGIKTLMCHFKGLPLSEMVNISWYDNTSVTLIEHFREGYEVLLEGDDSHLEEDLKTVKHQDWVALLEEKIKKAKEKRGEI
jgi:probable phosphoglycerate mutase